MIKDLIENPEGPVNEIFMVKQQTKAVSNSGSPYLSLTLQDNSGTVDAKMWSIDDNDIDFTTAGQLIRVYGQMSVYKGHPQLKINSLDPVDLSEVELGKYIPVAPVEMKLMKSQLEQMLSLIKDDELHALVESLIRKNYDAYTTYPAAVTVHHAYLGGLLFHSLSIAKMAIDVAKNYPDVSLDYLLAGSLLHDIGKIKELSGSFAVTYTDQGNLLGHISLGTIMVYEEAKELQISEEKVTVLCHMLLSHHGEPDFGSPKIPMTKEAYILHVLDDLDAKLECLRTPLDGTQEGSFTNKNPWLGNVSFYKPHELGKKVK